jgi:hypothetical protein
LGRELIWIFLHTTPTPVDAVNLPLAYHGIFDEVFKHFLLRFGDLCGGFGLDEQGSEIGHRLYLDFVFRPGIYSKKQTKRNKSKIKTIRAFRLVCTVKSVVSGYPGDQKLFFYGECVAEGQKQTGRIRQMAIKGRWPI